ncbi:PDDEXK nuclease domain-containing protein [Rhodococcus sp. NPDC060086]|uniref:PDDEXK nuclease domain-containing protein n=1 Tax=Rhodococcus sp. NPDC060086 TaxID=3347055 RepID=UPI0036567309
MGSHRRTFRQARRPRSSEWYAAQDPFALEFLAIDSDASERELEDRLVARIIDTLCELSRGFAFVGRQVHFDVDGDDYYLDLLLFRVEQLRYVVIELETTKFDPRDAGQVAALALGDAAPRRAGHRCNTGAVPTLQIILSILTLIAAGTSAFLVWRANTRATEQRELQARREEWWRRFQYATELALDINNPHRSNVGVQLVRAMITSSLAGRDELLAADTVLDEVLALGNTGSNEAEDHDDDHHGTQGN